MALPPNMNMPPVPRDAQEASFSEIVPLRSTKINLKRSALLYVAIAAAIVSVLGFSFVDGLINAAKIGDRQAMFASFVKMEEYSTFVILMLISALLYFYAKPRVSFWVCCIPAVLTYMILYLGIFGLYYDLFDKILPGHMPGKGEPRDVFPMSLVHAFFGPGLREELTKGVFILFGAFLTFRVMKNPRAPRASWIERIRVTGPLDGVILGIFAGAGFVMIETSGQYIAGNAASMDQATGNTPFAIAFGLTLLIPRVVEALAGHMGYSAIFGYFIGLAVIRPKDKWKLIGIGYLVAAGLHGAWDAVPEDSPISKPFQYVFSILTAVIAVGVLLKARQLETVLTGHAAETTGSIVVERPIPAMQGSPYIPQPAYPGQRPPQPQQGYAPPPGYPPPGYPPPGAQPYPPMGQPPQRPMPVPPQPYPQPQPPAGGPPGAYPMPPAQQYPPAQPAPQQPIPAAAPLGASAPAGPLVLDLAGVKIPLGAGPLDLGGNPALGGRGAGVTGIVVPHPARPGVLGLRNTGAVPWNATLRDGSHQVIDGDKNIRLAPGVSIDFGGGLTGAVTPA